MPKFLHNIDLDGNELQNAVVHVATSAPTAVQGKIYFDSTSTTRQLLVYNGSAWVHVGYNSIQSLDVETTIASGDKLTFSDESEVNDINNSITIDNLIGKGLQHVTEAAIDDGDYMLFLDGGGTGDAKKEALHDIATKFSGTGLTASSSVIGVDASQAITALTGGGLTIYEDANNADVSLKMGTGSAESLTIEVLNGGSNKTAEQINFTTATASTTANHGKMVFNVDGTDRMTIDDSGVTAVGSFIIGSADLNETDLEKLDGITNGTGAASKAVVLDASSNIASIGTIGCGAITSTGILKVGASAGSGVDTYLYTAGAAAHVGVHWDADLATEGTLKLGVDDHGVDFIAYGETSGQYMHWDFSADELILAGDTKLSFHDADGGENIIATSDGHLEINSATTLDVTAPTVDLNASTAVTMDTPSVVIASATSAKPVMELKNTHDDATGPTLKFTLDTADSAAADDVAGTISFFHDDADNNLTEYGRIQATSNAVTAGSEGGKLHLGVATTGSGTYADVVTITGGAAAATSTVAIAGHLTVEGTTTTVNSTTVDVADININLGNGVGDDTAVDGGGITLESTDSNKTFTWVNSTDSWTSNQGLECTGVLKVGGATTLNGAVTLGDATGDDITNTGRWVGDFVPKTDSSIDLGTSSLQFAEAHIDTGHIDAITAVTVDATTDFTIDGLVLTADTITNDANLTIDCSHDIALSADGGNVTMDDGTTTVFDFNTDDPELKIMDDAQVANWCSIAVGANGATTISTVDNDAAAANLIVTADGTVDIDSAGVLTLDSGAAINIEPASGSAILLDGTVSVDGGSVTGITTLGVDSVSLTAVQTSGESFVDNDTSIMTSAAILDKIQAESGTASVATTVTITDNEDEDEENAILFSAGADADGGNLGVEQDHSGLTYNPSSGTLTATNVVATTAFVPDASDGSALGTSSLEFSDLFLADAAVIALGDGGSDVTLTHVADTGILLNSTNQLQFGDSGTYIFQSADGVLDLVSDTEIEINATTIDVNGDLDVSGTGLVTGVLTTTAEQISSGGMAIATNKKLQFRDSAIHISSTADGDLAIAADDEVDITSTLIDINGAVDISGATTITGVLTTGSTIELGHASATTLTGSSGALTVEGFTVGLCKSFDLIRTGTSAGQVENENTSNSTDSAVWTIYHGMGASRLYSVEVILDSGNYDTVYANITRPSDTTVVVTFGDDVANGAYRALVTKIG